MCSPASTRRPKCRRRVHSRFPIETYDEAQLMVVERIGASIESVAALMAGSTPRSVIERYRGHVAPNAQRLAGA